MARALASFFRSWLIVGLAAFALPATALAQAGALDRSFGGDGKVTTDLGSGDEGIEGVAVQSDGKIVVAGYIYDDESGDPGGFVARYLADGSLDGTFGVGGIVSTAFIAPDIAVQADGKIVVVGGLSGDFAVARFLADGSPDPLFGTGGMQTTDFFGGEGATAVALHGETIVVAGLSDRGDNFDFAVARYTAAGAPDLSFSSDGQRTVAFSTNDRLRALAVQANGRIVLAGETDGARLDSFDFALVRLRPDGSLDRTFSGDGKLKTNIGFVDRAYDIAIRPNGRIIAAGTGSFRGGSMDFVAVQYRANGALDRTFSGDGKQHTSVGGHEEGARGLVLQPNGRIVLVGPAGVGPGFALVRYRVNGTLDRSFSGDGKQTTRIGAFAYAWDVARQADGRIVVVGTSNPRRNSGGYDLALARFRT